MAAPTIDEYQERNPSPQVQYVTQAMQDSLALFSYLPFRAVGGMNLKYSWPDTLGGIQRGTGNFDAYNATGSSATTTEAKDIDLRAIFGKVEMGVGNAGDRREFNTQLSGKVENVRNTFLADFAGEGGGVGNAFKGLQHADIVDGDQILGGGRASSNTAKSFNRNRLDQTMDLVEGGPDAILTGNVGFNKIRDMLFTAPGGSIGEWRDLPSSRLTRRVLTYNDAVILRIPEMSEYNLASSKKGIDIYAVRWDDGTGSRGLAAVTSSFLNGLTVGERERAEDNSGWFWPIDWMVAIANFRPKAVAVHTAIDTA